MLQVSQDAALLLKALDEVHCPGVVRSEEVAVKDFCGTYKLYILDKISF